MPKKKGKYEQEPNVTAAAMEQARAAYEELKEKAAKQTPAIVDEADQIAAQLSLALATGQSFEQLSDAVGADKMAALVEAIMDEAKAKGAAKGGLTIA